MSGSLNVKEHMLNLINALTNLSPSRNILSQLLVLLPEDLAIVECSYPEAASPGAKEVLRSLGVNFGDKVERIEGSFAEDLYKHLHNVLDWLDNELIYEEREVFGRYGMVETLEKMSGVRSSLAKLTKTHINSIPNPYKEWAKLTLRKMSNLYGKDKVSKFLKALLAQGSFRDKDYKGKSLEEFFNKLRAEIQMSPSELKELQRFIVFMEGGSERVYSKGSRRYQEGDVWIEHSKYHLDPLICESYRYESYQGWGMEYEYRIRHKESLSEALREAFT